MGDPLTEKDETRTALRQVVDAAGPYLDSLADRPVYDRAAEPLLAELAGPLPEDGHGTGTAVETLLRVGTATATASAGRVSLYPNAHHNLDQHAKDDRVPWLYGELGLA